MTALIRPVEPRDHAALWTIAEPIIVAGETYTLPRDLGEAEFLAYWLHPDKVAFVLEEDGQLLGTSYLRKNQLGGGAHVANAGFMTAAASAGRGVASRLCRHAEDEARTRGFRAMQFNFVVAENHRAIGLWRHLGYEVVGRLPSAFLHPHAGFVDALVMFKSLSDDGQPGFARPSASLDVSASRAVATSLV